MKSAKTRQSSRSISNSKQKAALSQSGEGISHLATTPSKKGFFNSSSPNSKNSTQKQSSGKTQKSNTLSIKKNQTQMKITETLKFREKENKVMTPLKIDFDSEKKTQKQEFDCLKVEEIQYPKSIKVYYNFAENINERFTLNTRVNLIRSLIELATNQNFYGISNISNKNIAFWKKIKQHQFFSKLFTCFSVDTLKKAWEQISSIKDLDSFIDLIEFYRDTIEKQMEIKIISLISAAKKFLTEKKDWVQFIEILSSINTKKGKSDELIVEKEEVEEIKQTKKLGKKRNRSLEDLIDVDEVFKIYDECNEEENKNIQKENEKIDCLNEIVQDLKRNLNHNYNEEFILEALNINSMDVKKTFDFLKDPNFNKNKVFSEFEDNIIQNLRHTKLYYDIVDSKGQDVVLMRERFLKKDN